MEANIRSILGLVAGRCATNIERLWSAPLQYWIGQMDKKGSSAASAWNGIASHHDPNLVSQVRKGLKLIAQSIKEKDLVASAIITARFLMQSSYGGSTEARQLIEALELYWWKFEREEIALMVGSTVATEDCHDEYEDVFDISETKKSSIYRYILKLARYHVAASRVFQYLLKLKRGKHLRTDMFEVATVYGFQTTSTTIQEHDYSTFGEFVETFRASGIHFHLLSGRVQAQVLDGIWASDLHQVRYLHCELQLAIFYLLNSPELIPMGYFIGVCKYSCKLCVEFLK